MKKSGRLFGRMQQVTCRDTMFLCLRVRMIATSRFRSSTGFRRLLPAFASPGVLALCASNSTFFTIYTQNAMLKTRHQPETLKSAAAKPEHDILCSSHDKAYCKIQPAMLDVHVTQLQSVRMHWVSSAYRCQPHRCTTHFVGSGEHMT